VEQDKRAMERPHDPYFPKRLLIYVHDWAPTVGGIQTVTQALARGVAEADSWQMAVTLATMTPANGMDDAALPYRVVRRPGSLALLRMVMEADVVHVHGPCLLPLAYSLLLRKPVVVEHDGLQAICPNGHLFYEPAQSVCPGHFIADRHLECMRCNAAEGWWRSVRMWLLTFVRRAFCARAARNIVPTEWLGGELRLPRIVAIPHGSASPPARLTSGIPAKPVTFHFTGRLVSVKGVQLVMRAAERLAKMGFDFRVTIAGDGPERPALESLAHDLGIAHLVVFHGELRGEVLERVWMESTVVVAPSLTGDTFGLVVSEAMLRGRPVIVPAGGALAEVAGGAGAIFPVGDIAGLAECMRRFLDQPELAAQMGRIAQERSRRDFAEDTMVRKHARLYAEIATPPRVS
jgi:glycogen(starch) synthase